MARTYRELSETYKINYDGYRIWANGKYEDVNPDDFDIIVETLSPAYATNRYRILKKPSDVTTEELVKICDRGGYNFGHRWEGNVLVIYVD